MKKKKPRLPDQPLLDYLYLLYKPLFRGRRGGVSPPFDLLDRHPPRGLEMDWRECQKTALCLYALGSFENERDRLVREVMR